MKTIFAFLSVIFFAIPCFAQAVEPEIIPKDKNLISVPVTVSDKDGRYIPNLKKDDFSIYENGIKQKISFFSTYDEPLNIAVLLDTSGSTTGSLGKIKDAAKEFIDLLNPKDGCLIATFDAQVNVLSNFLFDRRELKKTLDEVRTAEKDGTVLREAIDQIVKSSFTNREGRNVIIVLSDGKDFGSSVTQNQLISSLEESDVVIYTILYKTGVGAEKLVVAQDGTVKEDANKKKKEKKPKPPKKKGYSIMIPGQYDVPSQDEIERREKIISVEAVDTYKELSDITAGRFYTSDTPDLERVFKKIATELRQHYWLGYRSTDTKKNAAAYEINVKVEKPEVVVRTRGKFRPKQL
jgi:VWFA-related protein